MSPNFMHIYVSRFSWFHLYCVSNAATKVFPPQFQCCTPTALRPIWTTNIAKTLVKTFVAGKQKLNRNYLPVTFVLITCRQLEICGAYERHCRQIRDQVLRLATRGNNVASTQPSEPLDPLSHSVLPFWWHPEVVGDQVGKYQPPTAIKRSLGAKSVR